MQGSAGVSVGPTVVGGVLTAVLVTPTLPAPHAQSQGGHVAPGAQLGQAHVQVRPPLPPVTPPQAPPPQAQVHGEHVSPGAHTGQSQVHVPPPLPDAGFEQSHWTAGQSAFAGQTTGWTQVQPPPEASRT